MTSVWHVRSWLLSLLGGAGCAIDYVCCVCSCVQTLHCMLRVGSWYTWGLALCVALP